MYFTSNGGCQNTFVYQQTVNTLELKKAKVLTMFLVAKQMGYNILNLNHFLPLSYIA